MIQVLINNFAIVIFTFKFLFFGMKTTDLYFTKLHRLSQVNSSPQLVSLNSSGCPGGKQYSGNMEQQQPQSWEEVPQQQQQQQPDNHLVWEQQRPSEGQQQGYQRQSENKEAEVQSHFSQSDRVNLNTRLKTMILNKQQSMENKTEENQKLEQNQTGHFLSYSHHRRLDRLGGDGGDANRMNHFHNQRPDVPKNGYYPPRIKRENVSPPQKISINKKLDDDNLKMNVGSEIPPCECFPLGNLPPEPGSYYTHLGKKG